MLAPHHLAAICRDIALPTAREERLARRGRWTWIAGHKFRDLPRL